MSQDQQHQLAVFGRAPAFVTEVSKLVNSDAIKDTELPAKWGGMLLELWKRHSDAILSLINQRNIDTKATLMSGMIEQTALHCPEFFCLLYAKLVKTQKKLFHAALTQETTLQLGATTHSVSVLAKHLYSTTLSDAVWADWLGIMRELPLAMRQQQYLHDTNGCLAYAFFGGNTAQVTPLWQDIQLTLAEQPKTVVSEQLRLLNAASDAVFSLPNNHDTALTALLAAVSVTHPSIATIWLKRLADKYEHTQSRNAALKTTFKNWPALLKHLTHAWSEQLQALLQRDATELDHIRQAYDILSVLHTACTGTAATFALRDQYRQHISQLTLDDSIPSRNKANLCLIIEPLAQTTRDTYLTRHTGFKKLEFLFIADIEASQVKGKNKGSTGPISVRLNELSTDVIRGRLTKARFIALLDIGISHVLKTPTLKPYREVLQAEFLQAATKAIRSDPYTKTMLKKWQQDDGFLLQFRTFKRLLVKQTIEFSSYFYRTLTRAIHSSQLQAEDLILSIMHSPRLNFAERVSLITELLYLAHHQKIPLTTTVTTTHSVLRTILQGHQNPANLAATTTCAPVDEHLDSILKSLTRDSMHPLTLAEAVIQLFGSKRTSLRATALRLYLALAAARTIEKYQGIEVTLLPEGVKPPPIKIMKGLFFPAKKVLGVSLGLTSLQNS